MTRPGAPVGLARHWSGWRQLGRSWPRKVRTRLTVIYAGLFLAGGSALLGLTYGLLAASLPAHSGPVARPVMSHADFVKFCKQPAPAKSGKPPKAGGPQPQRSKEPHLSGKRASLCSRAAYAQGASAGSSGQRQRALHNLLLFSGLGLGIMTLASGGAGWFVSGRVLRPVRAITETARRASEQHLGERIGLTGSPDELKELADTFDDMLERLDLAFSAQRRFVADASHELRTPLTVMRTAIDVTLAKPARSTGQLESMAIRVRAAIDRAESMIDALLTLAVSDQGTITGSEPCDLATATEDALDTAAGEISKLGLRVHADLAPAQTPGNASLLDRMIGNLIDNAIRHNEPGGVIRLESGTQSGRAFVRVANSGPAIPAEVVPSLFEPFRRLGGRTGHRTGVGLGLAIVRSVAAAHGATVRAESRAGGGLDVLVTMAGDLPPG